MMTGITRQSMFFQFRRIVVCVIWMSHLVLSKGQSFAPIPWPCDGFYFSDGSAGVGYLSINNPNANNFTYPWNYNAIGFNPIDKYIYGISRLSGGERGIVRFHADGTWVQLTTLTAMGITLDPVVGTFDENGYYYIREGNATNPSVAKINLNNLTFTLDDSGSYNAKDWAYRLQDKKLYGVDNNSLHSFTPGQGSTIRPITGLIGGETPVWGSAFFAFDGYLYAVNNVSYNLYKIDVEEAKAYFIAKLTKDPNDGASCYAVIPPYSVTYANDDKICIQNPGSIKLNIVANDSVHLGKLDTASFKILVNSKHGSTSYNKATGELTYTNNGTLFMDSLRYEICSKGPQKTCHEAWVYIYPNNLFTPEFDLYGPYCQGVIVDTLPNISKNDIKGRWNSNIINTAIPNTSTYTFYPNKDFYVCIDTFKLEIKTLKKDTVLFNIDTSYCQNEQSISLSNFSINNIKGTWVPNNINTSMPGNFTLNFNVDKDLHVCTDDYKVNYKVNQVDVPYFDIDTIYCQGEIPVNLNEKSINNIEGSWLPNAINTLAPGLTSYFFKTNKSLNECSEDFRINIAIKPNQNPSFDLKSLYCINAAAEVLPSFSKENIQGTWSPAVISTNVVGNFQFVFIPNSMSDACIMNDTLGVEVTAKLLTPDVSDLLVCYGDTIPTLKVTIPIGSNILWYDEDNKILATNSNFLPPNAGKYSVQLQGQDQACDSDLKKFEVKVNPKIEIINGRPDCSIDSTQYGYSIEVKGGSAAYQVSSSTGNWTSVDGTRFLLSNIGSGDFLIVQVEDKNKCFTKDTIELGPIPSLTNAGDKLITCKDTCTIIEVTTSNEVQKSFNWAGPNLNASTNTNTLKVCNPGNYQCYTKDIYGCVSPKINITVNNGVNSIIAKIIGPDTLTINCRTRQLLLTSIGSTMLNTKKIWTSSFEDKIGDSLTVTKSGSYTLTVMDTITGCFQKSELLVTENVEKPSLEIAQPDTITCLQRKITINGISNNGLSTFQWFKTNGIDTLRLQGMTQKDLTTSEEGIYCLELNNQTNYCRSIACSQVHIDTVSPVFMILGDNQISCLDDKTSITVKIQNPNAFLYNWTPAIGLNNPSSSYLDIYSPGNYKVEITNKKNGCIEIDSIEVMPKPVINLKTISGIKGCNSNQNGYFSISEVFNGKFPFKFEIDGISKGNTTYFDNLAPKTYHIKVVDSKGCMAIDTVKVYASPTVEISLPSEIVINANEQLTLTPIINVDSFSLLGINWSPSQLVSCATCLNTKSIVENDANLTLTLTDSLGCQASAKVSIKVIEAINIVLPNIILPGSISNSIFTIPEFENITVLRFKIYDRWGNLVHNGLQGSEVIAWDGTFQGTNVNQGVYVYDIVIKHNNEKEYPLSGDITVIR